MKKLMMLLCAFAAGAVMGEQVEFRDYDADTGTFTNAWSGMADSVALNGTPLSTVRYLAPGVGSADPAGAISPAEFERIDIVDGKALLDVSVYTSDALTNENWSVATNGVIEVPAPGKQGFFILKSKGVTK